VPFLRWDGELTRESTEAALYEVWLREICRSLGRRFSAESSDHYQKLGPDVVVPLLAHPDGDLFGADPVAARDALLRDALRAAHRSLEELLGGDASQWSWGRLHSIRFRHDLDQQPGASEPFDLGPLPRPGDGYTVNASGFDASGTSWEQNVGASYRQILDTSNWDQSLAVNTPGQSGQPGSRHYADLMPLWDAGRYFQLSYSRTAVEASAVDTLLLRP